MCQHHLLPAGLGDRQPRSSQGLPRPRAAVPRLQAPVVSSLTATSLSHYVLCTPIPLQDASKWVILAPVRSSQPGTPERREPFVGARAFRDVTPHSDETSLRTPGPLCDPTPQPREAGQGGLSTSVCQMHDSEGRRSMAARERERPYFPHSCARLLVFDTDTACPPPPLLWRHWCRSPQRRSARTPGRRGPRK